MFFREQQRKVHIRSALLIVLFILACFLMTIAFIPVAWVVTYTIE